MEEKKKNIMITILQFSHVLKNHKIIIARITTNFHEIYRKTTNWTRPKTPSPKKFCNFHKMNKE